jgi:NTE family protein
MTLGTIITSSMALTGTAPARAPVHALVLMGGGARTAYQAGVLKALRAMLGLQPGAGLRFPFELLVGTSAGALNAAFLAGQAGKGLRAFHELAVFWQQLRSDHVYALEAPWWLGANRLMAATALFKGAAQRNGLLDSMPLVDTLHKAVGLQRIEEALQSGALQGLAVTASSYTTGVHWTFCQLGAAHAQVKPWHRPGRRAELGQITIDHLVASAAIPFLFPAVPLWVQSANNKEGGAREYFGDGSMRQISPLSPAMHLGANKMLVIGVGQPERAALGSSHPAKAPTLGVMAGHAMASVFHDTLQADVEQAQRVSDTLRKLPPELSAALPYRPVQVLAIQPSKGLDEIAHSHMRLLPRALRRVLASLGARDGSAAGLASYLLFEADFIEALMALGEHDAYARKADLLEFFAGGVSSA